MAIVFICSPYKGDVENNTLIARRLCKQAVARSDNPIAPHLLNTQFLDDNIPAERSMGLRLSKELVGVCDSMFVFADNGISAGMREEIEHATDLGKPIKFVTLED